MWNHKRNKISTDSNNPEKKIKKSPFELKVFNINPCILGLSGFELHMSLLIIKGAGCDTPCFTVNVKAHSAYDNTGLNLTNPSL